MAGTHSRHRCPLHREDPLIIIAFQLGRVVFHPGGDNDGWKKWESKEEEEEEEEGLVEKRKKRERREEVDLARRKFKLES